MSPDTLSKQENNSVLLTGSLVEAARAALQPPGQMRWIIEARADRVELRAVVRRWSTALDPSAQLARIACGTALRGARLAVSVQGRQPLVAYPERPGLLAVVHPGIMVPPRRAELLLHSLLRQEIAPAWCRARLLDRPAALQRLRSAAEAEGTWLRVLPGPVPAHLGRSWQDTDDQAPAVGRRTIAALVGAPGRVPAADLRVGQAIETLRLTAMVLGLEMHVLAAPADSAAAGVPRGIGAETRAIVRFDWPHPC